MYYFNALLKAFTFILIELEYKVVFSYYRIFLTLSGAKNWLEKNGFDCILYWLLVQHLQNHSYYIFWSPVLF